MENYTFDGIREALEERKARISTILDRPVRKQDGDDVPRLRLFDRSFFGSFVKRTVGKNAASSLVDLIRAEAYAHSEIFPAFMRSSSVFNAAVQEEFQYYMNRLRGHYKVQDPYAALNFIWNDRPPMLIKSGSPEEYDRMLDDAQRELGRLVRFAEEKYVAAHGLSTNRFIPDSLYNSGELFKKFKEIAIKGRTLKDSSKKNGTKPPRIKNRFNDVWLVADASYLADTRRDVDIVTADWDVERTLKAINESTYGRDRRPDAGEVSVVIDCDEGAGSVKLYTPQRQLIEVK